jgi:predicted dehydrogenase
VIRVAILGTGIGRAHLAAYLTLPTKFAVKSGFVGFFDALSDSLAGHEAAAVTAQDGRRSIELVASIYQAARTGQTVVLPLGGNSELYRGRMPVRNFAAKSGAPEFNAI